MNVVVAYRLHPVYEIEPGGIATAAVMSCMATGRTLSGMGGGGRFLAPEVVRALDAREGPRVICDGAIYERLTLLARHVTEGTATREEAEGILTDLEKDAV